MKHKIALKVERRHHPQRLLQSGITPAYDCKGIAVTVTNQSEKTISWINVALTEPVNLSGRQWGGDNQEPYTYQVQGHYVSIAKFVAIEPGKSQCIFHVPTPKAYPSNNSFALKVAGHVYGHDLNALSVSVAYGAYSDGEAFEQWHKNRHKLEVTESVRNAKCFIATAVYEDPLHPVLHELRFARDEIFARTMAGRSLIKWYYERGPRLAAIVAQRPGLRRAARYVLSPTAAIIRAARRLAR